MRTDHHNIQSLGHPLAFIAALVQTAYGGKGSHSLHPIHLARAIIVVHHTSLHARVCRCTVCVCVCVCVRACVCGAQVRAVIVRRMIPNVVTRLCYLHIYRQSCGYTIRQGHASRGCGRGACSYGETAGRHGVAASEGGRQAGRQAGGATQTEKRCWLCMWLCGKQGGRYLRCLFCRLLLFVPRTSSCLA